MKFLILPKKNPLIKSVNRSDKQGRQSTRVGGGVKTVFWCRSLCVLYKTKRPFRNNEGKVAVSSGVRARDKNRNASISVAAAALALLCRQVFLSARLEVSEGKRWTSAPLAWREIQLSYSERDRSYALRWGAQNLGGLMRCNCLLLLPCSLLALHNKMFYECVLIKMDASHHWMVLLSRSRVSVT